MSETSNIIMIIILGITIFGIVVFIITEIRQAVVRSRVNMQVPAEFVQGIGGEYGKGPFNNGSWRLRVQYMYGGQLYETVTVDSVNRKNYPSS